MKDPEAFNLAQEKMAPDMRLFCLLKTEANMGVKIGWNGIMVALRSGVDMNLIRCEDLEKYRQHMIDKAHGHIESEDMVADLHVMGDCVYEAAEVHLNRTFVIRPRHVMATLAELNIVKMCPLWKEFWDDEED